MELTLRSSQAVRHHTLTVRFPSSNLGSATIGGLVQLARTPALQVGVVSSNLASSTIYVGF